MVSLCGICTSHEFGSGVLYWPSKLAFQHPSEDSIDDSAFTCFLLFLNSAYILKSLLISNLSSTYCWMSHKGSVLHGIAKEKEMLTWRGLKAGNNIAISGHKVAGNAAFSLKHCTKKSAGEQQWVQKSHISFESWFFFFWIIVCLTRIRFKNVCR